MFGRYHCKMNSMKLLLSFFLCVTLHGARYAKAISTITPCPYSDNVTSRELIRCNFSTTSVNNLGGNCSPAGTCAPGDPEIIRYDDACTVNGETFDVILEVAAGSVYSTIPHTPGLASNKGGVNNNGVIGTVGQVNQKNGHEVVFQTRFETKAGEPVRIAGESTLR